MRKTNLLLILLIFFSSSKVAGQDIPGDTKISLAYPVFSQYLQNGLIINPAYAGSREVLSLFLSGRLQWAGIKGAPILQTISMHSLLKNNRIGLGLSGQFLQYGFSKSTSVYADYAYHLKVGTGKLSMGLRAGFDMSNTNYAGIILIDPNDPVFAANDKPYILPNVGTGLYYYTSSFFVGAAIPSFLSYVKSSSGKISLNTFKEFEVLATAGALITISPAFRIKPSVFVDWPLRSEGKVRVDLNGNFIIYDFVWLGGSWRTSEQVAVGILQFQINPQLMFGYSYDYPVGNLNTYSKGSHEVIVRYEFGYKVSAANPRYF